MADGRSAYASAMYNTSPVPWIGEEGRLTLNDDKVFKVWEQWAHRRGRIVPRFSTPKRRTCSQSEPGMASRGGKRKIDAGKVTDCIQAIKRARVEHCKTIGNTRNKHEVWSSLRKVSSESDLHVKPIPSLEPCFVVRSEPDIRASGVGMVFSRTSQMAGDRERTHIPMDEQRGVSCHDVWMDGKVVDESMCDFLAEVDNDKLDSFLEFFEKMTRGISDGRNPARSC